MAYVSYKLFLIKHNACSFQFPADQLSDYNTDQPLDESRRGKCIRFSIPEIIGGMLDLEPRLWRNPRREAFEAQKSKVMAFGAKWKEFDFTKKKNKGED